MNAKVVRAAKTFAGCLVFLSILAVTFVRLGYLAAPNWNGLNRGRLPSFYGEEEKSLDIASIGSSALYRFVDVPRIYDELGLTSFNVGTAGMPGEAYINMIKEVQKTQEPQLYIFEMRCFVKHRIHEPGIRRMTNNMNFSLNRAELIMKLVKDPMEWDDYLFNLTTYHEELLKVWDKLQQQSSPEGMAQVLRLLDNEEAPVSRIWTNSYKTTDYGAFEEYTDLEPAPIAESTEQSLREFLSYIEEENIPALLLMTPYVISEENAAQTMTVSSIIGEYDVDYLDMTGMTEELGLDAGTDFIDRAHVNTFGAEKVTGALIDYLQEHYDLKGEHTEAVDAAWARYVAADKYDKEKRLAALAAGATGSAIDGASALEGVAEEAGDQSDASDVDAGEDLDDTSEE